MSLPSVAAAHDEGEELGRENPATERPSSRAVKARRQRSPAYPDSESLFVRGAVRNEIQLLRFRVSKGLQARNASASRGAKYVAKEQSSVFRGALYALATAALLATQAPLSLLGAKRLRR